MKTYTSFSTSADMPPCVATIGFFDGVHCGHRFLIQQVTALATASKLASTVITFRRHPRQVLQNGYIPPMLSTLDSKLLLLSKTGIDNCAVLDFDMKMAQMTAPEFMKTILLDRINVRKLIIGYDNRFGYNRSDGFADYVRYGRRLGMEVIQSVPFDLDNMRISSSFVRSLIAKGDIATANRCLGRPYTISGTVVEGFREGRKLGFPTANIDTSASGQLVPANGVYAVKVRLEQTMAELPAMMNIGTRPTYNGSALSMEVNIFNFNDNIYGQCLQVSFLQRLREERRFGSVGELRDRLEADKKAVEEIFKKHTDK